MERGIRQGCLGSSLLFIFVLEILPIQIRNDNETRGLSLPFRRNNTTDESIKIIQHADICTGLIKYTESSTKILKTVLC